MKRSTLILLACSALAACGKGGSTPATPTGQVAATAAGQEITTSDIKLEFGGNDPAAAPPGAQAAALQAVVNRKLLSEAAVERGVDKAPVSAMMLAKARELALIQMLQQAIVARVPKPSAEEAGIYISDNPQSFAQRHLIAVDQLIVPQATPALLKALEPAKTMEAAIAVLDGNRAAYRTGAAVVDTAAIDPAPARQLGQLAVGAVFLSANGPGVVVSRVSSNRLAPLAGATATQVAQQAIYMKRVNEQVRSQFEAIIKAGQSGVRINPAFKAPTPSARPATPPR